MSKFDKADFNNDGVSSVFSDPAAHNDTPSFKGSQGHFKALLAIFAAVALLAGVTVAVIKLVPEREEETISGFESITVLSLNSNDFKTIEAENQNGGFKLYSEVTESETSSDGSESTKETVWYADGCESASTDTYKTAEVASAAASLTAVREITTKTAAQCGLDSPKCRVTVTMADGGVFSILVGDVSPDNTGSYIKLSNSDKIYIAEDSLISCFDYGSGDFVNN